MYVQYSQYRLSNKNGGKTYYRLGIHVAIACVLHSLIYTSIHVKKYWTLIANRNLGIVESGLLLTYPVVNFLIKLDPNINVCTKIGLYLNA